MDDVGLVPLEGGYSGETFLGTALGERTVVRVYAGRGAGRGPRAVEVDAAVLRLVRGLLPVAEVLEVRRPDPATGTPAVLVTSFLPGVPLDRLLPRLGVAEQRTVGDRLGALVARLAMMPMPAPGVFVDADLRVEALPGDLVGFVEHHLGAGPLAAWSAADRDRLLVVADEGQGLLDRLDRTCLVHGDLNPKNLLVDPATLQVTGLVDWEYAHAGTPVTDLGNLVRFHRGGFAGAVVATYQERVVGAPDDLVDVARAVDLFSLVELATRPDRHAEVRRAEALLAAVARTGDLQATA